METRILPVDAGRIGRISARPIPGDVLDELEIHLDQNSEDAQNLSEAARQLQTSDVPVAFPTETVYGLGADATRSSAVRGIYNAKQRPSDNPLIVHFASLKQLRSLLNSSIDPQIAKASQANGEGFDPIPAIYHSLIAEFWPGPLTIILPNPENSPLAPEVTAGLATFGARIPRHPLALALIHLAGVPVAAPSANASTKPSPTAAEHVAYDLDSRIRTILDGGPCDVGVESTVVDGMSDPPLILRPGGISIQQIRSCAGWEKTQNGYQNTAEQGSQPRAPGMKYRHYSPKATVILYEAGKSPPSVEELRRHSHPSTNIGIIRTRTWTIDTSQPTAITSGVQDGSSDYNKKASSGAEPPIHSHGFAGMLQMLQNSSKRISRLERHVFTQNSLTLHFFDIGLGADTGDIARGIFSALRDLDRHDVGAIFVEGIDDSEGNTAAAIMNRLRKAAEIRVDDG